MEEHATEDMVEDPPQGNESEIPVVAVNCYLHEINHWSSYCDPNIILESEHGCILEEWTVGKDEYVFYRATEDNELSKQKIESMKETAVLLPIYNITKNGTLFCTVSFRGTQLKDKPLDGLQIEMEFASDQDPFRKKEEKVRSFNTICARFCATVGIKAIQKAVKHREYFDIQEFFTVENKNIHNEILNSIGFLKEKYGTKPSQKESSDKVDSDDLQ
jgi:hypothetical protein